ncbi:hypothetical protein OROMI_019397 [Orobanche minor]
MSKSATESIAQVFLDELDLNVTGPVVAMICRKWDVNAVTGHYLSTDFLISDGKGNTIHCSAKSKTSHNFVNRLKEGIIYTINDFAVLPNTADYRIKKENGFMRHPFDLVDFDDLHVSNNNYLIDVVRYVTNVGRSTQQRTGSKTLDFYLTNQRGQSVRVTLWGSLDKIYLSSSSSALILDDAEIPAMKGFISEAKDTGLS